MNRTPRLNYFTGNRLELLVDRLADALARDPLAPGIDETILVPSRGMGSWLTRELAQRWEIAASLDLPFPARFVDDLAARFDLGRPEPIDPFRPQAQLWELHEIFWKIQNEELQDDDLTPVSDHLRDDGDGRKRYQLARRVGALLSSYQFARAEEIGRWDRGEWFAHEEAEASGERWQRALWRLLREQHEPADPPAQRILELVRRLGSGQIPDGALPERVSVFGASSVPPMITQVLVALSLHRPVDLYLLVPTPGYIADLRNRRERERQEDPLDLAPAQELVGELGRLGREFFETLLDLDAAGGAIEAAGFADPGSSSALRHLQSALHASGTGEIAPAQLASDDRSIQLHSCHSPLREMEVLRDEVLACLADGVVDSVSDVMLLVPDIRKYAPLARSVFGGVIENLDGTLSLPVRVADRSGAADQPFARLLLSCLELASARLTLGEVFALLQEPVVCARFGLVSDQLDALRDRLAQAGVVWGEDPQSRARRTHSAEFSGVSWREGIDRLLLGCFTGPLEEIVQGILPASDATVSDTEELGRLATALDQLFALVDQLQGPHTIDRWVAILRSALLELSDATTEREAEQRSRCLALLEQVEVDARDRIAPVGRLALLDQLQREFGAMDTGGGFVSGQLTVAELRPMRSLPAGVIVVAGLDADSFPRPDPRDGLDLVGSDRRRGDRSPRDDDRQLFLELLLCARERLILSYVGRSQQDDRPRTLSPCVQELLDALRGLGVADVTVEHPLQPFAGIDCQESTYDHAMVRAAGALDKPAPVARFIDRHAPDAPERPEHIDLADLRRFWRSPCEWFCKEVAQLSLSRDREEAETESLILDGLQKWRVRDLALRSGGLDDDESRLRSQLSLPRHALMDLELGELRGGLGKLEAALDLRLGELVDLPVQVAGEDFTLDGFLRTDAEGGPVEITAGSTLGEKYLVQSLAAHAVAGSAGITRSTLVVAAGKPTELKSFKPLMDAKAVLALLVEGYRLGQRAPLRFFPSTSRAFAKILAKNPGEDPLQCFVRSTVRNAWSATREDNYGRGSDGESLDEAVALCMRGLEDKDICDQEFILWATRIHAWLEEVQAK